ncbi:MAG: hypothetical protein HUN04_02135 [Desulfobacter sp.]|nr:MAG: hypothetical protein HUN04_02135 [Desulfobacter sp.]
MNQNSLGNYRSDISNLSDEPEKKKAAGDDIQAAMYHQEVNTLKIEKLSQRITIISIIIPCIIIAILAFAYIDMKERVVDVDETQGSHVEQIARTLEEKLNALDVRIAKATFDLDEKLALIEEKSKTLENQAAKISSSKADLKSVETALAKIEKRIKANAGQDKSTLAAIERVKKQLQTAIKKNNDQFKTASGKIKEEIQLFKEEFDARLLELSAYEQEIAALTKSTGLLDKKIKTLKSDIEKAFDQKMDSRLATLKQSLEKSIKGVEDKIKAQKAAAPKAAPAAKPKAKPAAKKTQAAAPKPAPEPKLPEPKLPEPKLPEPVAPPVSTTPSGISEQNLTQ